MWALTEEAAEKVEDEEAEDLLSFANSLDFEEYLDKTANQDLNHVRLHRCPFAPAAALRARRRTPRPQHCRWETRRAPIGTLLRAPATRSAGALPGGAAGLWTRR